MREQGSVRCIRDMLNDEGYDDYSLTSEMHIADTAYIHRCHAPPSISLLDRPLPEPEPPPYPLIKVEDVSSLECVYDALFSVGESFPAQEQCPAHCDTDTFHLLWDTHMFPVR